MPSPDPEFRASSSSWKNKINAPYSLIVIISREAVIFNFTTLVIFIPSDLGENLPERSPCRNEAPEWFHHLLPDSFDWTSYAS